MPDSYEENVNSPVLQKWMLRRPAAFLYRKCVITGSNWNLWQQFSSDRSNLAFHIHESATRKIHQRISIQHASHIFIPISQILHQVLTYFWCKRLRSLDISNYKTTLSLVNKLISFTPLFQYSVFRVSQCPHIKEASFAVLHNFTGISHHTYQSCYSPGHCRTQKSPAARR